MTRHPLARAVTLAATAILAAGGASAQEGAGRGRVTVEGRVVDAVSGQPVIDATVQSADGRHWARTTGGGRFLLRIPGGAQEVAVHGMGYQVLKEAMTLDGSVRGVELRVQPDPVAMEGIRVQVDQLDARIGRSSRGARVFRVEEIASFRHPNTLDFLRLHAGLRSGSCGARPGGNGCQVVRGIPSRSRVFVDDLPTRGGVDDVDLIPLASVFRIEILQGGDHVRVYTKHYIEQLATRGERLPPLHATPGA